MIKLKIKMDFRTPAGAKNMEHFMLPVWKESCVSFVKEETV